MDAQTGLFDAAFWITSASILGLIMLSAFFSGSETALTAASRGKLRAATDKGSRGAERALAITEDNERLIGSVLLGNNMVNILASAIATVIALRLYGDAGIAIATLLLTLAILIFSEVTPKTMAAMHPEGIAFTASHILRPLLFIFYPLVWLVNHLSNGLLRLLGVNTTKSLDVSLSKEEIRTVVYADQYSGP